MKRTLTLGIFSALAIAGLVASAPAPAFASEALPAPMARQLDQQDVQFTASAAKRERMMIIQQNMNRQRQQGRGSYGSRRGYGSRDGYGPRPGYSRPPGYQGRPYRY